MANRPRRSKATDKAAPTTIDLAASPADAAAEQTPAEPAGTSEPDPAAAVTHPAAPSAEPRADTPAKPGRAASAKLPSPRQQPTSAGSASAAEQAASVEDRMAGPGDKPAVEDDAATEFAVQEGFTRPLSDADLGDFGDDDTAASAAEPDTAAMPEATPYREPEMAAAPAATGSLVGAAVAGGATALILGGILLYSGILPGLPTAQPAASQFAAAGDVQRLNGDLSSLREAVEQLQSAQAAGGATSSPVSASDFAAVSDRLAAAERTLQSGNTASGDLAAAIDSAGTDIASVRESADAARQAADAAAQTANGANEAATGARDAAQDATRQVADLGGRIDTIEAANSRAAGALAAASLKAAIDRGGPFMPELETFAASGGGDAAVAALRDRASSGVPTLAQLQADWPDVERSLLLSLRPAGDDAAVGDQLLAGFRSLVTVRPEGEVSATAEGPEGAVGRMDAALQRGDLAAFLTERGTLPDAAQQASADFAAQVEARQSASDLVGKAIDDALGADDSRG